MGEDTWGPWGFLGSIASALGTAGQLFTRPCLFPSLCLEVPGAAYGCMARPSSPPISVSRIPRFMSIPGTYMSLPGGGEGPCVGCSSKWPLQSVKMPRRPGRPQSRDLGSQLASPRAMRHGRHLPECVLYNTGKDGENFELGSHMAKNGLKNPDLVSTSQIGGFHQPHQTPALNSEDRAA